MLGGRGRMLGGRDPQQMPRCGTHSPGIANSTPATPQRWCVPRPSTQGAISVSNHVLTPTRRVFLSGLTFATASAFFEVRGAFAEQLARTPRLTEGPFYPRRLPLDTDNDLIIVNGSI